jgi:hypothetical protein
VALVCTVPGRRPNTFSKLDNYGYGSWSLVIVEQHDQTTFGKSGQRAPHMSLRLFACLRGQSAVISLDQSNSFAPVP